MIPKDKMIRELEYFGAKTLEKDIIELYTLINDLYKALPNDIKSEFTERIPK